MTRPRVESWAAFQVALIAVAAACCAARAEAAVIYEWVDENGRIQMSDVVPKKYKRTARRLDSSQFDVSPEQLRAAQAEAAALKARAAESAAAPPKRPPSRVGTPVPAASAATRTPSVDFDDCSAWRRAFVESRDCFASYQTVRGGLRPGAFQACGPAIPSPEPKCGPEE